MIKHLNNSLLQKNQRSNVRKEKNLQLLEARPPLLDTPTITSQTEGKSHKRKLAKSLEEYRSTEK